MRKVSVTADYGEGRSRTLSRAAPNEALDFMRAALKYDRRVTFTVTRHRSDLAGLIWL